MLCPPPSTESASGGVSEDAPICYNVCELCGAPISVQGCTCLRERRQRGVSKQNSINNSDRDKLSRRKPRYRPRPLGDGVPRRSKRLAKRQERTRAYRTANTSSKSNVKRVMAKTKSKLCPDPQHILDDMNGVRTKLISTQLRKPLRMFLPPYLSLNVVRSSRLPRIGNTTASAQFPFQSQTVPSESF